MDVEIVDAEQMTGAAFAVQLKSVDALASRPQVRIRMSTLNYWREVDRLVLLVLWDASSDTFWCRWAHRVDPYGSKPDQKTLTVNFDTDDVLNLDNWARVESEVMIARSLRRGTAGAQARVTIRAQGSVAGNSAGLIKSQVLQALRSASAIVDVSDADDNHLGVRIARDELHFEPRGQVGSTIHYNGSSGGATLDAPRIVADVCLGIARELHGLGFHDAGSYLVREHWRISTMAYQGLHAFCVEALAACGAIDDAIELAREVDDEPEMIAPLSLMHLSLRPAAYVSRERVAAEIREWVSRRHPDVSTDAVRYIFDLARHLVVNEGHERALEMVQFAEELDPSLRTDLAWQGEVAGHAFLSGQYADAAERYELAAQSGGLTERALWGDALLWSGKYQQAIELWKAEPVLAGEYWVKGRCFEPLCVALRIEEQERDDFLAERTWREGPPSLATCIEALRHDLLYAPALSWLAEQLIAHELFAEETPEVPPELAEFAESLAGFEYHIGVCAAMAYPAIPELWHRVILVGPPGDAALYREVVKVANRMAGAEIVESLYVREYGDEAEMVARLFEEQGKDSKP